MTQANQPAEHGADAAPTGRPTIPPFAPAGALLLAAAVLIAGGWLVDRLPLEQTPGSWGAALPALALVASGIAVPLALTVITGLGGVLARGAAAAYAWTAAGAAVAAGCAILLAFFLVTVLTGGPAAADLAFAGVLLLACLVSWAPLTWALARRSRAR